MKTTMRKLAIAACLGAATLPGPAAAEPVLDRILSGAQVTERGGCTLLRVGFNIRIRYLSHFPGSGNQLSIKLAAVDPVEASRELLARQESVPAPMNRIAGIRAIDFDARLGTSAALLIQFARPMAFKVAPAKDFQSLIVAIAPAGRKPCAPVWTEATADQPNWSAKTIAEELPPETTGLGEPPSGGKLSAADRKAVAALMDRSREAMGARDHDAAIRALTRILSYPKSEVTREASELLGVAHQRKGDIARARSLYQDYLARYPAGAGAARVKERLASLADAAPARKSGPRTRRDTRIGTPGQPAWTVAGSFSQYYMRDDGFRTFVDPSLPPQINKPLDEQRVFQNEVLSSLDTTAQWGNADYQSKLRFSGAYERGFGSDTIDLASVATLSAETKVTGWGLLGRAGRQTRNTGGVLGRFDGLLASWQVLPWLRFDTVVGSPVLRRRDVPFKDGSLFYGEAVNFGPLFGAFDTTLYVLEQRTAGIVDRRVAGTEVRYADETRSAFASIDYDFHFNTVSAAILNGTWTLADKSVLSASAEHRSTPGLLSSNALIGQTGFGSLSDMLALKSPDEIRALALDRTAFADSVSVGFARPLSEHLQLSLDAAWFSLGATPASDGVPGTPASGNEFYVSGQLTGTDWFKPSDLYVLGLRYATTPTSDAYAADLSARYPVTDKLRVGPRLRLSYRTGGPAPWEEYAALPSLQLNYQWAKGLGLELETGAKFSQKFAGETRDTESEVFVTFGYRYDFDAQGETVRAR